MFFWLGKPVSGYPKGAAQFLGRCCYESCIFPSLTYRWRYYRNPLLPRIKSFSVQSKVSSAHYWWKGILDHILSSKKKYRFISFKVDASISSCLSISDVTYTSSASDISKYFFLTKKKKEKKKGSVDSDVIMWLQEQGSCEKHNPVKICNAQGYPIVQQKMK